jgi:hypothetical protein
MFLRILCLISLLYIEVSFAHYNYNINHENTTSTNVANTEENIYRSNFPPVFAAPSILRRNINALYPAIVNQLNQHGIQLNEANILFPGRSLPLIQASMEILQPDLQPIAFPVSNFYQRRDMPGRLDATRQQQVFQHLDQYVGIQNIRNGPIVVMDYSDSGQSLILIAQHIRQWLVENGNNGRVISIGLGGENMMDVRPRVAQTINLNIIPVDDYKMRNYFVHSVFDTVSPVIEFDIFNPPGNSTALIDQQRDKYENFKEFVGAQLLYDLRLEPGSYEVDDSSKAGALDYLYRRDDPSGGGPSSGGFGVRVR